jgi:hypothetical protein
LRLLGASLSALAVIALGACGDDGEESDGVFDREDFSFTFEYPDGFTEVEEVNTDLQVGSEAAATAAVMTDDQDGLLVEQYELSIDVDASNLDLVQGEIERLFQSVAPDAKPRQTEVAGLPALEYESIEVPSREGAESRFVFIFEEDREYLINCQSTDVAREEVAEACELALSTFAPD